jgi:hypothetical protein
MTLKIGRDDATKEFTFKLAEAAQVLRDNQRELLQGELVPLACRSVICTASNSC